MDKLVNFFKKRSGAYISIETVIVGGLVVGLGALAIGAFEKAGNTQVTSSVTTVNNQLNPMFSH